jgi:hypothetical protein
LRVEGPLYSLDTVVVRGTGCNPNVLTGATLTLASSAGGAPIALRALGSPQSGVQPDGSVSVTYQTPLLAAGTYGASLGCTGSQQTDPTAVVTVIAGPPPAATLSVTSPIADGGTGTMSARHCGRSAHGEIQASARAVGPGGSFSFYGSTRSDGAVDQTFTVPAGSAPGTYTMEVTCGRNAAQTAKDQFVVR